MSIKYRKRPPFAGKNDTKSIELASPEGIRWKGSLNRRKGCLKFVKKRIRDAVGVAREREGVGGLPTTLRIRNGSEAFAAFDS